MVADIERSTYMLSYRLVQRCIGVKDFTDSNVLPWAMPAFERLGIYSNSTRSGRFWPTILSPPSAATSVGKATKEIIDKRIESGNLEEDGLQQLLHIEDDANKIIKVSQFPQVHVLDVPDW
jgi:hypothetical protein